MLYREIGQRIRKRRLEMKLTQQQFAERVGISMSFYGHIERGTRKLSVDTLYRIVQGLDCSADEILGTQRENPDEKPSVTELLKQVLWLMQE